MHTFRRAKSIERIFGLWQRLVEWRMYTNSPFSVPQLLMDESHTYNNAEKAFLILIQIEQQMLLRRSVQYVVSIHGAAVSGLLCTAVL